MSRLLSSLARAAALLVALGVGQSVTRCNLYEGRSLDLFPASADLSVECRDYQDCPRERAHCARGSCVQCLLDADCDRRHPACVGNTCVECRSARDCDAGQSCNSVLELCAPACVLEGDCAGPEAPRCSRELALCVQCVADVDCKQPKDPVCGPGGRCVGCRSDSDCAADANKPVCLAETRRCAECRSDAECATTQTCDVPAARCTPALEKPDAALTDPMKGPMPSPMPGPMPPPPAPAP